MIHPFRYEKDQHIEIDIYLEIERTVSSSILVHTKKVLRTFATLSHTCIFLYLHTTLDR